MKAKQLKDQIISILEKKNGVETVSIDLMGKTSIADFFVITTAKNPTHAKALAEALEKALADINFVPTRKEGLTDARWIVLDYSYVIVHIFNSDTRDLYCLEALWKKI